MKRIFFLILLTLFVSFRQIGPSAPTPVYRNPVAPVEQRIADLLGRMTTEEKIRQLDMYWGREVADMHDHEAAAADPEKLRSSIANTGIGSVHDLYPLSAAVANDIQRYAIEKTRLGIPVLFIEEGLHGYSGLGSTSFPIPLALSTAFDTTMVREVGRTIAAETRAHGVDMILGPVLDLARDPRWGRVEETYGEDPFLNARNGVAMVEGLQGSSLSANDAVISEPKHFAVHSVPEAGSNTSPVNMGEREARSAFLYVFEKAVREAKAMGIMAAYSEIDGIPCVDNKWLLTDVLRKEWGFKGFVLSDLGAIKMTLENHHVASDIADAISQALNAGLNMQFYDFGHDDFLKSVQAALRRGQLSVQTLNRAVADVLRVKFMLGLFDHPYTDTTLIAKTFHTEKSQELALRAATEGICLLKNQDGILPIKQQMKSIAVIGPLGGSTYLGGYSNEQSKGISIVEGLKQRADNDSDIRFEKGYDPDSTGTAIRERAVTLAKSSDMVVLVLGEEARIVGEGKDRATLDLGDKQIALAKALRETGKPVAIVLFNGRPLSINWIAENMPAIVEAWFLGEKGGLAIADILLGKANPSGKLPISFPRSVGQLPFYYNYKPTSRHAYVDEANTPLYVFGHGLSYTQFRYSNLKVSPATIPVNGHVQISVRIENTGAVEGTEVAQLYIRDLVSSVTMPERTLKGFARISLKPGESGTVHFTLNPEDLSLWNREMKRVVEPGMFSLMVGSSSRDIRLTDSFRVVAK
ncbi:MAG TPA: glycoside hydrolase family 3 N-terminal domain-containing protein [Puia sp.]|nr:glycoside hydrolase family 3 N-terminal domain-containing protein [Puia sp.]